MLSDLARCNNYLEKHPAPPCTRCLAEHKNYRPVCIKGQWLYLCDSCRAVYGLLDRFELAPEPVARPKPSRAKKPSKGTRKETAEELFTAKRVPFTEFLERFLAL